MPVSPIRFVTLNVSDLDRSVDFYTRLLDLTPVPAPEQDGPRQAWLSAGPTVLRLSEVPGGRASAWIGDDLQRGFRHIGLKVVDLDARVERLHAEGVRFHLEPLDAAGGVRIAFFYDPDGVLLEFIQGDLQYDEVWDEELVTAERAQPVPAAPRFDHVAVTVDELQDTLGFYRSALGFGVAGRLFQPQDPRGFEITYLHAAGTVLEVFTYGAEKQDPPWRPDADLLGFRGIGVTEEDPDAVADRLAEAGAKRDAANPCLLVDRDGLPVLVEGVQ
ncbi:VOC family protein [Pseudonocardia nigra]|uniref:VOC family protein n=1 Tax=Pseudonocardia nigra TaxID=1921578 RepID=UPI001C5EE366|nr:VOC family protein [Pseudonocardia nigra]